MGINIDPIDEVSATAEPDIPAKNILANIFTAANPPLILPMIILLKFTIRLAIPPLSIILPIRIKKGIQVSTKLLTPENILWNTIIRGKSAKKIANTAAIPNEKETGIPRIRSIKNVIISTRLIIALSFFF